MIPNAGDLISKITAGGLPLPSVDEGVTSATSDAQGTASAGFGDFIIGGSGGATKSEAGSLLVPLLVGAGLLVLVLAVRR